MTNMKLLAEQVAKELGWHVDPAYDDHVDQACIRREFAVDAAVPKIYFRLNWQKTKIEISGGWPHGPQGAETPRKYSGEEAPQINVGVGRDAAAIAKDIRRRFLDAYLTLHATCLQRVRDSEFYRVSGQANADRISQALGGVAVRSNGDHHTMWIDGGEGAWTGTVEVTGDAVSVHVRSLSVDETIRVVELLKKLNRAG